ncbi:MAG: NAD(P)/FAD-dependent oxidoreductase [Bacilli bacterium]|nr:NAD(P)/FAD-dependent oxidoreductase [Bacilli bacterium]
MDNIKIFEDLTESELTDKILKKNKISLSDFISLDIVKKSIDARDKKNVHYNYSVNITLKDESKYNFKHIEAPEYKEVIKKRNSSYQPIIVGSGPAGLFCALTFIDNGYKPIIIEQGSCVEDRIRYVEEYKTTGKINELCNVQFGEGGAGTFSDGKLTTGINSPFIKQVLENFYKFGAPEEITYLNKPHIGTDNLINILKNMRSYIESKGGEYHFNTKLTNIENQKDTVKVITTNGEFETDALVLAIGHSARDTFKMLKDKNMNMMRKNFSVGVRIEHKQSMINESQYGTFTKLNLSPAEYKLVYHGDNNRSCYSFCMCPGGEVIASSSEKESIVTNGMSVFKRDKENANAALLVNVLTTDFDGSDPLAGMYFQEELEKKAFILGGSNYNAPVQRVEDFIKNIPSTYTGNITPSYKPGYTLCNLNDILPTFVAKTLKEGILAFDRKIKGFANPDAILTGVETRSSSPITIPRNDELMSNIPYIYPCGEGAGYAGGITSAAVDGI